MSTDDPPCTISPEIVLLVADISEAVGRITSESKTQGDLKLRRINRIRTIRGTLAIEGNTLGEGDVTALIEGKRVIAPAADLLEAVNAIKVYEQFSEWDSLSEKGFLKAHGILMKDLADDSGCYRSGGVGVVSGADVIHMAPPAGRVPDLMKNLFSWVSKTDHHPLISSSIFHYEFEFIHPFSDGNGRIGRLWQSLLFSMRSSHLIFQISIDQHRESQVSSR